MMTMSTMMTVSIMMNRTMTLTLIMIQLNLSRTPMYSSQSVNSSGSNHQSQENYHDDTLLAHRSNLTETGTTAQSVQGDKYASLPLNFQSASDSPPSTSSSSPNVGQLRQQSTLLGRRPLGGGGRRRNNFTIGIRTEGELRANHEGTHYGDCGN